MVGLLVVMSVQTLLNKPRESEELDVSFYEHDVPRMNEAIQKARSTFDTAIGAFKFPDKKVFVKVGFPTVGESFEHIWLIELKQLSMDEFEGEINNEPLDLGDIKLGDRVKFKRDMVSDWIVVNPTGKREGEFTRFIEPSS